MPFVENVVLIMLVVNGTCEFMEMTFLFTFLEGVSDADLVLLVTTRPTTGNTLAWAVACERDQWGRAIAGRLSYSCVGLNGGLYLAFGLLWT